MSLVSLLLYLVVLILTPSFIRGSLTEAMMQPRVPKKEMAGEPMTPFRNFRDFYIRNFVMLEDGTTLPANAREMLPSTLLQNIMKNAVSQQEPRQLYESNDGQVTIRYFIHKDEVYGRSLYQVAFLRKSEEEHFVNTILIKIMLYAGIALIFCWFASLLIVRYLTRPLIQMEQHVKSIADRNWHNPLTVQRNDEIGHLAGSIETMRQQLVKQDEAQRSMLQNISHELKTPVMVIRSYAQAMKDGVYPKGDLAGSIQVIEEEGNRLEKLVKQLLYLTRLDYLATQDTKKTKVELDQLVEDIILRFKPQRQEISWDIKLIKVKFFGDEDTLRVLVENLLENHLRHAASRLEISLRANLQNTQIALSFWNDGSFIEPHVLNELFLPFQKGREGKYGLGLTIVQRIVKVYEGNISLQNERNGVSTTVTLPQR